MSPVPTSLMRRVIEDALRQTGATREGCRILRADAVTWSDGSLGCPEPGMHYTQALVMGYWIVLDVQGTRLDYRATRAGQFRRCSEPDAAGSTPNPAI